MSNAHIENFLEYYLKLKESPGYAVLLSGDWGSGKTWFLKTFMDTKDHKYLWASFNGVSRYSEIEDQFFEQLHPRLASKEMKLAGKIFKGLLKATVKIDWDDDGKADGSATIQNPDLKKSDFLNTDKYVVVFDDIERSQMEIEEVLGYINQYVEVVGQKVICICNEKDIIEKTERYQKIREKVIGKVFEVNPDFQEILGEFLKIEDLKKSKIDFSRLEEPILKIFTNSKSKNLRVLKQGLLEFDRIFGEIDSEVLENEKLAIHLFSVFLIFYIEVHLGNYLATEITNLTNSGFFYSLDNSSEKKKATFQKYDLPSLNTSLLPDTFWESILGEGYVPLEQISDSLKNSEYFATENTPLWRKIWRITDLTDNQFDEYYAELEKRIGSDEIEHWGEVVQIAGIYRTLNKKGLTKRTTKDITSWAKEYINKLRDNGKLLEKNEERYTIRA